jgi:hypothetical protein
MANVPFKVKTQLLVPDSAVTPPLNITERSAPPSTPGVNDIYLDDGTNTASGSPGWRRCVSIGPNGWEDVGAVAGGSSPWSKTLTVIHPTTGTDTVAIGGASTMLSSEVLRVTGVAGSVVPTTSLVVEASSANFGFPPLVTGVDIYMANGISANTGGWFGVRVNTPTSGGGGAISFAYGVLIDNQNGGDSNVTRGVHIAAQTALVGATSAFGLWQDGTANYNVLRGYLAVGNTAMSGTEQLRVTGDALIEGAAEVTGKLTVGGLIDPTGLVLTDQATTPYDPSLARTGTVSTTIFNPFVVGVGTLFTTELAVNDYINIAGDVYKVSVITDNLNLTLTVIPTSAASGVPYRKAGTEGTVWTDNTAGLAVLVYTDNAGSDWTLNEGSPWARTGTRISPTTVNDDVAIGAAAMVGTERLLVVNTEQHDPGSFRAAAIGWAGGSSSSGATDVSAVEVFGWTPDNFSITNAYGIRVLSPTLGSSNTLSNHYGLYVQDLDSGGQVTNAFGVYIADQTAATLNYGVYQAGTDDLNVFLGDVVIGTSTMSASEKLRVEGSVLVDGGGVGINTAPTAAGYLEIGDDVEAGQTYGVRVSCVRDGVGASRFHTGFRDDVNHTSTTGASGYSAFEGALDLTANATVNVAYGLQYLATLNSATAVVSQLYGVYAKAVVTAGTLTAYYGVYIDCDVTGTATTVRGIFIDDLGGTNVHGIWQAGSSNRNYFGGNVGCGTSTPDFPLQINGTVAPETNGQDLGTSSLRWQAYITDLNITGTVTIDGNAGLNGTYTFGGGGVGQVASMTFRDGILTAVVLVP